MAPTGYISAMLHDLGLLRLPESPKTGGTFEWLPIWERHALLEAAACVISQRMSNLIQSAQKNRVTKSTLLTHYIEIGLLFLSSYTIISRLVSRLQGQKPSTTVHN